jgi:hypothetical protein
VEQLDRRVPRKIYGPEGLQRRPRLAERSPAPAHHGDTTFRRPHAHGVKLPFV